jgi:serine/threonine protein kinase
MTVPAGPGLEGRRLGDFEVVRELGRGGMGVVYLARQVSLNRLVALKVLGGLALSPRAVQRFRREAEAAAKLHHTNIVQVFGSGEQDGAHFYAMELVNGPSLDRVLRQLRQAHEPPVPGGESAWEEPPTDLARTGTYVEGAGPAADLVTAASPSSIGSDGHYFDAIACMTAEVADALDYAHRQGVVHRDVKPANLLLSPDGRLSVNDFGVARLLEEPGVTQSGEFVGTPAYMSPEQVAAGRKPIDHRTDVYSLGATLYELLTLRRPFAGEGREQVLAQILHKEPRPPRKLNGRVPADLETVCLKALEKDPDRRYQTAGEMAEDLRRYVNRFAIRARRAGPVERLRKWVKRRPALAAALAGVVLLAAVAGAFAYRAHLAERQRQEDQELAREELLAERRQHALDQALAAAMGGDLDQAEKAIAEAERVGASPGQVRMLRGQVAFHRGDVDEAIRHLEQAVVLLPGSVAARGMLVYLYDTIGSEEQFDQLFRELDALTPVTPEDYLFKGYAESCRDSVGALAMLEDALRRHDSIVGRAVRAEVRAVRAMDTADLRDAEAAVADADVARALLPDNPQVLYVSVLAHAAAAGAYGEAGLAEKRRGALEQAGRDALALGRFEPLPASVVGRTVMFYATGTGAPPPAFEALTDRSQSSLVLYGAAWSLYLRGEFEKALGVLDRRAKPDQMTDLTRAFVLAELPDGPARALDAYRHLARQHPSGFSPQGSESVRLLLGRKPEVVAAGRDLRARLDRPPGSLEARIAGYLCGELTEEELLKTASRSKWDQCNCRYWIGLAKLAEGDRSGAREQFRQAVATRAFLLLPYDWSYAFLARLEKDPAWPPWIPQKK